MLIQRKEYLDKLIAFKDKQLIKIVTGIRRCGKSTLLSLYQDWLRSQGVSDEQIISINFEDLDYEELTDYKKLYAYLKEHMVKDKMNYIFLDEVHHIDNFPKVVDPCVLSATKVCNRWAYNVFSLAAKARAMQGVSLLLRRTDSAWRKLFSVYSLK